MVNNRGDLYASEIGLTKSVLPRHSYRRAKRIEGLAGPGRHPIRRVLAVDGAFSGVARDSGIYARPSVRLGRVPGPSHRLQKRELQLDAFMKKGNRVNRVVLADRRPQIGPTMGVFSG